MACDDGGCSTSCQSSANDCGCGGNCYSCSTSCGDGCKGTCTGSCDGTCKGTCRGSCDGCSGCGSACSNSCSGSCTGDCNNGCKGGAYTTAYNSFVLRTILYAADVKTLDDWASNEASRRRRTVYNGGQAASNTKITTQVLKDVYDNIKSAGRSSTYTVNPGEVITKTAALDYITKLCLLYEQNIK